MKVALSRHKARKWNKLVDNPQVAKVGPSSDPPTPPPVAEVKPPKQTKKGASDEDEA